ncbi:MAG: hypothetical protein FKGGLIKP_00369 [Sodalis sp. Fse]|nr:MAG: hypothetical protein FKGGLIKP_00369 [Sodalis sp. Fse]UVK78705.1 MAG: hypothetical protein IGNPGNKH_00166 [Sodalis sp. Ffu]
MTKIWRDGVALVLLYSFMVVCTAVKSSSHYGNLNRHDYLMYFMINGVM